MIALMCRLYALMLFIHTVKSDDTVPCISFQSDTMCRRPPKFNNTPGQIVPNFLIVGPAKSGTSNLLRMIGKHENVVIGQLPCLSADENRYIHIDASKNCLNGSSNELGYLEQSKYWDPIPMYQKSFSWREGIIAAGEKTPIYASSYYVPYYARFFLGEDLKLFYTYRDPVETVISFYMHFNMYKKQLPFRGFVIEVLNGLVEQNQCRQKMINSINVSAGIATVDHLYESALSQWQQTLVIEESLSLCTSRQSIYSRTFQLHNDYIQQFNIYAHLRRWLHAFSPSRMLCIHNDDQLLKAEAVSYLVFRHLGLKPHIMRHQYDGISLENRHDHTVRSITVNQWVSFRVPPNETAQDVYDLKTFFKSFIKPEQKLFIDKICPKLI